MLTYSSNDSIRRAEAEIGAKAANLDVLSRAGYAVPNWWVLCAEAFERSVPAKLIGVPPDKYASIIAGLSMPEEVITAIEKKMLECDLNHSLVAVRSSAIGEDSSEASFAGQLSSFLYAPAGNVAETVKKVWASAYTPHALEYFRRHDRSPESIRVAVVIQEMVDADVSGVAFSMDPVTGNRRACVISAVYGLGEGLVSGQLDADVYTAVPAGDNGEGYVVTSEISLKREAFRFDADAGGDTRIENIPEELQEKAALDAKQVCTLADTVRNIADLFGSHQDIEWGFTEKQLMILQSRPVTTVARTPDRTQLRRIWDNSNIVESYAGVTTPLTFSFVQDVYTEVYKQFCRIMGVESALIAKNDDIFSMVGLMKGRIYYNLLNWYKVLSLLPGYSLNAPFMEQMMGVREKMEVPPTVIKSRRNAFVQVGVLIVSLVRNFLTLGKQITVFYRHFNDTISGCSVDVLGKKNLQELVDCYRMIEKALLHRWQAPLVNDFFAMFFYGMLRKLLVWWKIDPGGTLQNDLLCGVGGIVSTKPIERLHAIAESIRNNEGWLMLFQKSTDADVVEVLGLKKPTRNLEVSPEYKAIGEMIKSHLAKFGDRCVGELKLETITPAMQPQLIISLIRSYLKKTGFSPEVMTERENSVRIAAEKTVTERTGMHLLRKMIFRLVLSQARSRVKNRENMRFERTRLFAVIRSIFCTMGRRLREEQIIESERDVFYLTRRELFGLVEGTFVSGTATELVRIRKEEYSRYEECKVADRFETFGAPSAGNRFTTAGSGQTATESSELTGTGCCAGVVRAPVRVIHDPSRSDDLEGCILVAERTDPGWAPLFPLATGLLVERGSLLSHSAIVAREMGIPAIVGIERLMERLSDGQLVEMDGSSGAITIIDNVDHG